MKEHVLDNYDGAILTYSREKISILNMESNKYHIIDIAKGLAYQGHFGGQTPYFYSVAQHSILVDNLYKQYCNENYLKPKPLKRLAALLHDAPEAFLKDMLKPYKIEMEDYQRYENEMLASIFGYYKIPILYLAEIKEFDKQAQYIQYDGFYVSDGNPLKYLSPEASLLLFLETYWQIVNEIIYEQFKAN